MPRRWHQAVQAFLPSWPCRRGSDRSLRSASASLAADVEGRPESAQYHPPVFGGVDAAMADDERLSQRTRSMFPPITGIRSRQGALRPLIDARGAL
jgi:hypothetical protein